jgi:hypothetical protein
MLAFLGVVFIYCTETQQAAYLIETIQAGKLDRHIAEVSIDLATNRERLAAARMHPPDEKLLAACALYRNAGRSRTNTMSPEEARCEEAFVLDNALREPPTAIHEQQVELKRLVTEREAHPKQSPAAAEPDLYVKFLYAPAALRLAIAYQFGKTVAARRGHTDRGPFVSPQNDRYGRPGLERMVRSVTARSVRAISIGSPLSTSFAASSSTSCCTDRLSASMISTARSFRLRLASPAVRYQTETALVGVN